MSSNELKAVTFHMNEIFVPPSIMRRSLSGVGANGACFGLAMLILACFPIPFKDRWSIRISSVSSLMFDATPYLVDDSNSYTDFVERFGSKRATTEELIQIYNNMPVKKK